ncbi:MAG: AAA family ATPase [Turicibacter sp.]|nr:AAA family ATPase [Turicibacter sp.]
MKALPIGIDDFEKIISENYYMDKTLLIKELLDQQAYVTLFTRPRRFGKSLNMSMLQHFFENTKKRRYQENRLQKIFSLNLKFPIGKCASLIKIKLRIGFQST